MVEAFLNKDLLLCIWFQGLKSKRMFRIEVITFPVLLFNSYWLCYATYRSQDTERQETEIQTV